MRYFMALFIVSLLAGCANRPSPAPVAVDTKKILILSSQGVSPASDTVGFNALVQNVTQAFSKAFSDRLAAKGFQAINVLDQQPGREVGQKMAVYAVKYLAVNAILPTIETKVVGTDTQLQLRIQYVEGEFIPANAAPQGLRAKATLEKRYVLRGSESGDTVLSMADIAKDFADFLETSGRLIH